MSEATRHIGGGVSYSGGVGTKARCPRISSVGADVDLEDSPYASIETNITNAQVAALRATPIEVIPAPGAGKIIQVIGGMLSHIYTAPAWTESADNLELRYTDGSGAIIALLEMTSFITLTANAYLSIVPLKDVILAGNAKVVLFNNGDGEFGNSGGSLLRVKLEYAVHASA